LYDPAQGFSDPKARSVGVRGQLGDRHAMPVTAAVLHPFLLWDGKADSAWLQPLKAIENPKEMDFTRVEVARHATEAYRAEYEAVFGPLPDLSAAPPRAAPGDEAWARMSAPLQDDVQRIFSNVGKAVEAYERRLLCTGTRFDQWMRGEQPLSNAELAGAETFHREGCVGCHSGRASPTELSRHRRRRRIGVARWVPRRCCRSLQRRRRLLG
jgi:cytochrome c peroxidase